MNHDINDQARLSLRPVGSDDFVIIEAWLNKEYIRKWYGDPGEWLAEIRNEGGRFDWIHHFIVMCGGQPIGFCQYYDCAQTQEGFSWAEEPSGTFGIDYLIGEENYLKKGLGGMIVGQLCSLIRSLELPVQMIADPLTENTASIRLLEGQGFLLDPLSGLYKLAVR